MRISALAFMLTCAVVFQSCGGGGGGATADAAGTWMGSWLSANGFEGGTLTFTLIQNNTIVSGSATFAGSPCFAGGSASGSVNGAVCTGNITAGTINIEYTVTITGNTMNGTFYVLNGGACTGSSGTVMASRASSMLRLVGESPSGPETVVGSGPNDGGPETPMVNRELGATWMHVYGPWLVAQAAEKLRYEPGARLVGLVIAGAAARDLIEKRFPGESDVVAVVVSRETALIVLRHFDHDVATWLDSADDELLPVVKVNRSGSEFGYLVLPDLAVR